MNRDAQNKNKTQQEKHIIASAMNKQFSMEHLH